MRPLYLLPYLCACLVNIFACALNRQTLRHAFKVALMPLLFFAYLLTVRTPSLPVTAALALGWIGDILLIEPQVEWRRLAGTGLFAAGHCFYLAAIASRLPGTLYTERILLAAVVWIAAVAAVYAFLLYPVMPKNMRLPSAGYFLLLAALGTVTTLVTLSFIPGGRFLLAGAVAFLFSDSVLCRQFFTVGDPAPKYDTLVMLSYTAAQGLLIWGLCR